MAGITDRRVALLVFAGLLLFAVLPPALAGAQDEGIRLFTPYIHVAVSPGDTVTFDITATNTTGAVRSLPLAVRAPEGWRAELTAGGRKIAGLAVAPEEKETFSLTVEVPLKVERGSYGVQIVSGSSTLLSLTLDVTEAGTLQTELTSDQTNMEGTASSTFSYELRLRNRTPETQTYALLANAPEGWNVVFRVEGKDVTSVTVEPNATKRITVSLTPPSKVKAGTYKIPVRAETKGQTAEVTLEAVIRGTYGLKLTTPNEVLSTDITAGGSRTLQLVLENTGSAPLHRIELAAESVPMGWEVTFDPKTVDVLEPGKTATVNATIRADRKAIAGDYVLTLSANAAEASASQTFRITVKTSLWWGIVGFLLIAAVVFGLWELVRRYGRR
ncbi:NEW3 domain-containing protein [Brockia lithotrophica]|uniref:Putative membrane protein n=1 Tax=Brockia lithotrophica TaxID=933949 RepID=A0A660L066_9BACL|nr:NEW3 domain-containing protein [Brockia lithotrophica]RKQ84630.1 putative membrane protein [Brockia lithotrophica]